MTQHLNTFLGLGGLEMLFPSRGPYILFPLLPPTLPLSLLHHDWYFASTKRGNVVSVAGVGGVTVCLSGWVAGGGGWLVVVRVLGSFGSGSMSFHLIYALGFPQLFLPVI